MLARWSGEHVRFFAEHDLAGARTTVLGPEDSKQYARDAGGELVPWTEEAEVVIIGDQSGYPFLEAVDATLSHIVARVRRGDPITLVTPNPDIVYPSSAQGFGVTCGGIATLLETALSALLGDQAPTFARLGKPNPAIFESAVKLVGTRDCVMLGDQLATDIRGAKVVGIDSAFVCTGVGEMDGSVEPEWVVRRLVR